MLELTAAAADAPDAGAGAVAPLVLLAKIGVHSDLKTGGAGMLTCRMYHQFSGDLGGDAHLAGTNTLHSCKVMAAAHLHHC